MPDVGCAGLLVQDTFCGPLAALPAEGALHLVAAMPVKAGGCAANVAIDLRKQGVSVDVAGCIGDDSAGQALKSELMHHQVGVSRVRLIEQQPTSRTVILLIEGQDRRYLHLSGANSAFSIEQLSRTWLAGLKIFYLGGLFALPGVDLEQLATLLLFCRERGIKTVVDVVTSQNPGGIAELKALLPLVDIFVPNEDEARAFTGLTRPMDQVHSFRDWGANMVIITRGGRGSIACQQGRIFQCGAYQMDVVDPSGSGDAFTSGVIRSLLEGWGMVDMLRYSSALGASATRAAGTTDSVFAAEEAEHFVRNHPLSVTSDARLRDD